MNRDKALLALRRGIGSLYAMYRAAGVYPDTPALRGLNEALNALSSPCACGEPIAEGWGIQTGLCYQGLIIYPHLRFLLYDDEATYLTEATRTSWARIQQWKALGRVIILPADEGAKE